MITNGNIITRFDSHPDYIGGVIKYPQVLVFLTDSVDVSNILFEIPCDIDVKSDLEFDTLPGSLIGADYCTMKFLNSHFRRIRFPYVAEYLAYEQQKIF